MMNLETIHALATDAGTSAQHAGLEPHYIRYPLDIGTFPPYPFPSLGRYRPIGWTLRDHVLVDSSSFGSPDEPALTASQLQEWLTPGFGYAIIEVGQFQIVLGCFEPHPNTRGTLEGRPVS